MRFYAHIMRLKNYCHRLCSQGRTQGV